jgi:beta-lactam-binding protein with PASTA domain
MAAAVLILGFVALFAVGGRGSPSASGGFPTTTTTVATSGTTTSTSIVTLKGLRVPNKRFVIVSVTVPNVVGMTQAQAGSILSSVGLGYGISSGAAQPSGTSSTGTVVAQTPAPGAQAYRDDVIQLTVSGY